MSAWWCACARARGRATTASSAFGAELRGPLLEARELIGGDGGGAKLERLEEVLGLADRHLELVRGHVRESHTNRPALAALLAGVGVARGARRAARAVGVLLAGAQVAAAVRHELLGRLAQAQRAHERVAHDDRDIGAREALAGLAERLEVLGGEVVGRVADAELEEAAARRRVGERDVDALLEAATHGRVEAPWGVGGAKHEQARVVVAHALHLDEELGLNATSGLVLAVAAGAAERVDLVDEDNRRAVLTRHLEEVAHEALRLALPLGHQVRGGDGVEHRIGLGGHRLGEVRLAGTGRPVQQDALPGAALAHEELGELDRKDDGFLEGLLGALQAGDVVPSDVGLLLHDGGG
mmetsp:Transcript_18243/g.46350  ORF Transcript_18243/g.46350 Transcript_18243/m.46350 type:complete len:354 (+) Transcript_18243:186-1247(+)